MGLDINLVKILTKSEVSKLRKKHGDLSKVDKIDFIPIDELVNCDLNIETFNLFKKYLNEKVESFYNAPAMLIKNKIKTKDKKLGNYYITGFFPSDKGEKYTRYEITHRNNEKDTFEIDVRDDKVNNYDFKIKQVGFYIKDVRYIQRKGVTVTKSLTGKCYSDEVYDLFVATENQLQKLNENNTYYDCDLKRDFKIPKNHVLHVNW